MGKSFSDIGVGVLPRLFGGALVAAAVIFGLASGASAQNAPQIATVVTCNAQATDGIVSVDYSLDSGATDGLQLELVATNLQVQGDVEIAYFSLDDVNGSFETSVRSGEWSTELSVVDFVNFEFTTPQDCGPINVAPDYASVVSCSAREYVDSESNNNLRMVDIVFDNLTRDGLELELAFTPLDGDGTQTTVLELGNTFDVELPEGEWIIELATVQAVGFQYDRSPRQSCGTVNVPAEFAIVVNCSAEPIQSQNSDNNVRVNWEFDSGSTEGVSLNTWFTPAAGGASTLSLIFDVGDTRSFETDKSAGEWKVTMRTFLNTGEQSIQDCGTVTVGAAQESIELVSPEPGSTLTSDPTTFEWTGPTTEYWVFVGTRPMSSAYHNSQSLGSSIRAYSVPAADLPTNGSEVWMTLWYKDDNNSWRHIAEKYRAQDDSGQDQAFKMVSPDPGAILTSNTVGFTWVRPPSTTSSIQIGTSQGASDVFSSGDLRSRTTYYVSGLPSDGSLLYLRLWNRDGTTLSYKDYLYTAFDDGSQNNLVELDEPSPGTILNGSTATFKWTGPATVNTRYWLQIGTSQAGTNIYNSGDLKWSRSKTVFNLPTDGSQIYVRLWHQDNGGSWSYEDYHYTTANS